MDTNYLDLMDGENVFMLSKRIVRQAWDRWKVGKKLGDQEDLVQQVCEILLSIKAGEIVYDNGRNVSFEGFVMGRVRGLALANWMLEAPWIKRPEQPGDKKDEVNVSDDTDVWDDKVADARVNTVTPARGGADQQADDDDIECDDDDLDDLDLDLDDEQLTPAHRLLSKSGTAEMARLLDCTSRTIRNMLSRAGDRQDLSEKEEKMKNKLK